MRKELTYSAEIPEGVEASLENKTLTVKSEKGENKRLFHYPGVEIKKEGNKIILNCKKATKNEKSIMGVFIAHVENMLKGVKKGFIYKLKICSGHFPMSLEYKGNKIIINNFLGEKKPRIAKIKEGVDVKIEGDIITLEGINKESVGQSSAVIEGSTRISNRDRRILQDGIFIIDKAGKKMH